MTHLLLIFAPASVATDVVNKEYLPLEYCERYTNQRCTEPITNEEF